MCNNCNNCNNCENEKCRLAVTVEDNYAPCTFPQRYFDVEIRSRCGETLANGTVAGGGSAIFDLPCDDTYSVTVSGGRNSAPRAQTRRVQCCCGRTSGVTFIFMTYEPECEQKPCPPPCPPPCIPCPPPCPPPTVSCLEQICEPTIGCPCD